MNLNWSWSAVAAHCGNCCFRQFWIQAPLLCKPVRSKLKRVLAAIQDNFCYTKKNSTTFSTSRLSLLWTPLISRNHSRTLVLGISKKSQTWPGHTSLCQIPSGQPVWSVPYVTMCWTCQLHQILSDRSGCSSWPGWHHLVRHTPGLVRLSVGHQPVLFDLAARFLVCPIILG
jgi:hypothetical protein